MLTPVQLRSQLAELGIRRELRVLTDWRETGLLPPLCRVGRGRGKGSQQFWDDDVLDRAIAVHWLLKSYRNADEALLGLWFSGYAVSADRARSAWIDHLKRIRKLRHSAAKRYKDRFLGLAKSGLKIARGSRSVRDFFANTFDWQYDDESPFDNEDLKNLLGEALSSIGASSSAAIASSRTMVEIVDTVWSDIDLPAILRSTESIEFVESMSISELKFAHESLARIRRAFAHWFRVVDSDTGRTMRVSIETKIMHGLFGPFFAKALVALNRAYPELPFAATIALLHDHTHNVKSADLLHREDGTMYFSERVRSEWQTVKEALSRLWEAAVAT